MISNLSILLLTLINSNAGLLNAASRPTEYDGPKQEPAGWWGVFWKSSEGNTGLDQFEAHDL